MTNRFHLIAAVGGLAAAALIAAGCGSGSSNTTSTAASAPSSGGSGSMVDVSSNSSLGQILVDSNGQTLYLFKSDTSGTASTCNGACAQAWPPYTTKGQPQAGSGVDAAKLTTLKRSDGTTQVVFDNHPLYTFTGDTAPGDVTGNGSTAFGAEWYAMHPDGSAAEPSGGGSTTTGGGGGGGGYSY